MQKIVGRKNPERRAGQCEVRDFHQERGSNFLTNFKCFKVLFSARAFSNLRSTSKCSSTFPKIVNKNLVTTNKEKSTRRLSFVKEEIFDIFFTNFSVHNIVCVFNADDKQLCAHKNHKKNSLGETGLSNCCFYPMNRKVCGKALSCPIHSAKVC